MTTESSELIVSGVDNPLAVEVVAGAANTKGSWTELIASASADVKGVVVAIHPEDTGHETFLIDIGTGSVGNENARIPNLPWARSNVQEILNSDSLFFPITASAGTRFAARCQCSVGGSSVRVHLTLVTGTVNVGSWAVLRALGADESVSRGTSVVSGNATKGSWVELEDATEADIDGLIVCVNPPNAAGSVGVSLDVGVGATPSVVVPDLSLASENDEGITPLWQSFVPISIDEGESVSVRMQNVSATNTYYVSILAVSYVAGGGGGGTELTDDRPSTWGGGLWGGFPMPDGFSTPGTFFEEVEQLDPGRFLLHRVRLEPQDPGTGSTVLLEFTDREWVSPLGESDHDVEPKVRLQQPFQYRVSLTGGIAGIGGSVDPSIGSIRILGHSKYWQPESNGRVPLDTEFLRSYRWGGYDVSILVGLSTFSNDEFIEVFRGKTVDLLSDDLGHRVVVAPAAAEILNTPIQSNTYGGTGGLDGDEELTDVPKPLCYGIRRNIQPVLIDRFNQIYQVHDGSVRIISAPKDRGVPYTFQADVADITATAPGSGFYTTQLSGGYFRLGSPPEGFPTTDVEGDNTPNYNNTIGEIARRIAQVQAGVPDAAMDFPSFQRTTNNSRGAMGVYYRQPSLTAGQALDQLMSGNPTAVVFGYRTFSSRGNLRIGQIVIGAPVATIRGEQILSLNRNRTQQPHWKVSLGYRQANTVQDEDDLSSLAAASGGPTDAFRNFASLEFRRSENEDATTLSNNPLARVLQLNTLLDEANDAENERDKALALLKENRNFYEIEVRGIQYVVSPGATVRIIDDEVWGLNGDFVVLELAEDAAGASTTLGVWG